MRVRKEVLLALALAFSALLSGCMDRAHYDRVEKKALQYYQNKYSKKDVEIVDSYKAGNNGLFGYPCAECFGERLAALRRSDPLVPQDLC